MPCGMVSQLPIWKADLQFGFLLLVASLAWRWGAVPERACAGAFLYMEGADWVYHWLFGHSVRIAGFEPGHFLIDLTAGMILHAVALRSNRLYPLCLAPLQLVAIISHLGEGLSGSIAHPIYAIMIALPSYLQLPILLAGVLLHRYSDAATLVLSSQSGASISGPIIHDDDLNQRMSLGERALQGCLHKT